MWDIKLTLQDGKDSYFSMTAGEWGLVGNPRINEHICLIIMNTNYFYSSHLNFDEPAGSRGFVYSLNQCAVQSVKCILMNQDISLMSKCIC